jgi:3-deoxy-D-manno-octulosonic-acid transferase
MKFVDSASIRIEAGYQNKILHYYFPFDIAFIVKHYLKKIQPDLCLLLETEIWPNLIHTLYKNNIPTRAGKHHYLAFSDNGFYRLGLIFICTWVLLKFNITCNHYFKTVKRSNNASASGYDILLGDSIGEMMSYFEVADVVFMGGSPVQTGGFLSPWSDFYLHLGFAQI